MIRLNPGCEIPRKEAIAIKLPNRASADGKDYDIREPVRGSVTNAPKPPAGRFDRTISPPCPRIIASDAVNPRPTPPVARLRELERAEHALQSLGRNPGPLVSDHDAEGRFLTGKFDRRGRAIL